MGFVRLISLLAAILLTATPERALGLAGSYLYNLSDPNGSVASSWAPLVYDRQHKELYVVDTTDGTVGVFNQVGMEVYRFGDDENVGTVVDIQPLESGELIALTSLAGRTSLVRFSYRGEFLQRLELRGIPAEFAKVFSPTSMRYRNDKIYLADTGAMKVVVTDASGACLESHDFSQIGIEKKKSDRGGVSGLTGMRGFDVDAEGNILFTVSAAFKAFVISPDGKLQGFGERGSAPGKFNIVGGITRDERGNYLVTDILRSVVMVFDREFNFRGEFGERGWDRQSLIAPLHLAAADGKVFVSQSARRGVSVFQLSLDQGAPAPR